MLLDSNIIIYSVTEKSPKQSAARKFISLHKDNLSVAHQNINESIRLLTHPKTPEKIPLSKATRVVTKITNQLDIITPKPETLHLSLILIKRYKIRSNQIFDAYIIATMLTNGISEIATDNEKDFSVFKEIKVFNPFK